MEYKDIIYSVRDGIATIALNRPETLNAETGRMRQEWADAIRQAQGDDDVRVVVVTGVGRAFCAGAHPREMATRSLESRAHRQSHVVHRALQDLDKPYIGAINGPAAGGGMDMASLCDIRLASEAARFTMAYIRMGRTPALGGAFLLPRIIGLARALELIWTSRTIDAQEALDIGYVSAIYPLEGFLDRVYEFCRPLVEGPQAAIRLSKLLVYRSLGVDDMEEALRLTSEATDIVRQTQDAREGPRAWLERRRPEFQGK